jgi:hypothetical protein
LLTTARRFPAMILRVALYFVLLTGLAVRERLTRVRA